MSHLTPQSGAQRHEGSSEGFQSSSCIKLSTFGCWTYPASPITAAVGQADQANQMLGDSPFDLIWLFLAMFIAGSATWVVIRQKLGRGLGNPVLRLRSLVSGERRPAQTSEVQADAVADGPLGEGVA